MNSIGRRTCEIIMKDKTPLLHEVVCFQMLDFGTGNLIMRSRNQIRGQLLLSWELRQMEPGKLHSQQLPNIIGEGICDYNCKFPRASLQKDNDVIFSLHWLPFSCFAPLRRFHTYRHWFSKTMCKTFSIILWCWRVHWLQFARFFAHTLIPRVVSITRDYNCTSKCV